MARANATLKGVGTINGSDSYQFILSATDGQASGGAGVDGFRIRITGPGGLVYDNQGNVGEDSNVTTAIGGGSIVIHKP